MTWDELSIELDEADGRVVFRRASGAGDHARGTLLAQNGLAAQDKLFAAVTATPWVRMRAGKLVVDSDISCRRLAAFVEEMLSCFTRDGAPDARLERIQARLFDDDAQSIDVDRLTWWHCAWLDAAVRDDAADLARSAADLWSDDEWTIDLEPIRRRRIEQLAQGMARSQTSPKERRPRLAASDRSRRAGAKRRRKSG